MSDKAAPEPDSTPPENDAYDASSISVLRGLDASQFARTAVFEGYGPVTLRGLAHYLCSHDQQHLSGLQWLLGKIDAENRAT